MHLLNLPLSPKHEVICIPKLYPYHGKIGTQIRGKESTHHSISILILTFKRERETDRQTKREKRKEPIE